MAESVKRKKMPRFAILNEEEVQRYARSTERGVYNLASAECFWRDRQAFLLKRGYALRPRYSPEWKPSWKGTNISPMFCEDSIMLERPQIIDARHREDNKIIAIKLVPNGDEETRIAQYLSSIQAAQNHCVPVLDAFPDPIDAGRAFLVMPYLRPCNDPGFCTVGEVIDFVDQTLEGLAFMHRHSVAHRDISTPNIMMDARPLYPEGHHPVRRGYTADGIYAISALARSNHPVRYYYIDFGLSTRFDAGAPTSVTGDVGRDRDVPEMSADVPYDAFKVDIFSLGHVYSEEFGERYNSMEFLQQLIGSMMQEQPELRPSMEEILDIWKHIKSTLTDSLYRWRLGAKSEPAIERAFNNTVAVAWEGLYHLRKLVN